VFAFSWCKHKKKALAQAGAFFSYIRRFLDELYAPAVRYIAFGSDIALWAVL